MKITSIIRIWVLHKSSLRISAKNTKIAIYGFNEILMTKDVRENSLDSSRIWIINFVSFLI